MESYDLVSSATHLLTAAWAAYATLILLRLTRGHGPGRWAVGAFGLSMVLLYLASGTFHGARHLTHGPCPLLQRLDKSAIFLLIAGSYTPVFVYLLGGRSRRGAVAAMLGAAAVGVAALWVLPDPPPDLVVGGSAGLGVAGLAVAPWVVAGTGWAGAKWIGVVAVSYLGGAAVEVAKWPVLVPGWVGPHEVLHVADMAGTLAMFVYVCRYLIRRPPQYTLHSAVASRTVQTAPEAQVRQPDAKPKQAA